MEEHPIYTPDGCTGRLEIETKITQVAQTLRKALDALKVVFFTKRCQM